MKVLFTGMSSSHCKPGKNQSFFKTLAKAYEEFATVTWSEPKLNWTLQDLNNFDEIVFGFSPPTSMGANHLYGAINTLNLLFESPKLKMVVDSSQVWQYKNSLRAFKRDPDQIFGSFYAARKNYSQAKKSNLRDAAEVLSYKLTNSEWPVTYIPTLPWHSAEEMSAKVSFIPPEKLVSVNLDSLLLEKKTPEIGRANQWAVDNVKSSWFSTTKNTLRFPALSVKNSTKPKDTEAWERINSSMGLVVAPQDRNVGTWWSYRYIQALNSTTPVATYWQESGKLSAEWGLLAYQLEDMQPYERQHIAFQQVKQYQQEIPDKDSAIKTIKKMVVDLQARG